MAPQFFAVKTTETCEKAGPGLETINLEVACNDARKELGVSEAMETTGEIATAACFLVSGPGDLKQTVRFDTDVNFAGASHTQLCASYASYAYSRNPNEENEISGAQSMWSLNGLAAATIAAVVLAMSQRRNQ